ncbi:MAG: DUF2076 domain-containing protein [Alphaproteobacteria bacterium]|nr:DUF2076 domain-containing protein [Alphaproteobacteria bacterium]
MTPQEKDMISQLLDRLKQAGGQPKDPEAEALIKAAVQAQPDAPYLLVQTALVQNMSLEGAQARIQELEREVAQAKEAAAAKPTSFLGGLLGGGNRPAPQPGQSMMPRSGGPVPQPGGYAPQQQGYAQPPLQAPAPGGGGSFLRTAAGVAAGVAGGALLYHGLSSMFSGGHGMGAGSQSFMGGGQGMTNSPWGNPQAGSGDQIANNLTPERDYGNQERDSGYQADDAGSADHSGGWDNSDSGSDSSGGWDSGDSGGSSSDDY